MSRKYYTVNELSERWAVSKNTLYKWVQAGKVPHTKLNGALRFSTEQISTFEDAQKCEQPQSYGAIATDDTISFGDPMAEATASVQAHRITERL